MKRYYVVWFVLSAAWAVSCADDDRRPEGMSNETGGTPGTGARTGTGGRTTGTGGTGDGEPVATIQADLVTASDCGEVATVVKNRIRALLDAEYAAVEAELEEDRGWGCTADGGAGDPGGPSLPSSVSGTNNQVDGVDEADTVKNDGTYLYVASDEKVRILKAWPVAEATDVATLSLGGQVRRLLLDGDRLIVYSVRGTGSTSSWDVARDCTYGYNCDMSGDGTATRLTVVDVADRAHPKVVRTVDYAGSFIAARRVGHLVHQVTSVAGLMIPGLVHPQLSMWCSGPRTEEKIAEERARLAKERTENEAKIAAASPALIAPATENGAPLGEASCRDFYVDGAGDGSSVTTLSTLDARADSGLALTSVLSAAGAVYATPEALYMAVNHRRAGARGWYPGNLDSDVSAVHRFTLGETVDGARYAGSGLVRGHALNQFSMDEHAGHFRIATSVGRAGDPQGENVVTTMKQAEKGLVVSGTLEGIAPREDIRSVRFDGEKGYVVTYRAVDPLFVLDLADPAAPKILGELKIPGFSTYMHRLDAHHLLAMGYEASETGALSGVQLQIFDVTNPAEPVLKAKRVFGTRGSSSAALTDHLAFTFLRDRGLLTLPMTICEAGSNSWSGSTATFSGVVALTVNTDGMSELGRAGVPLMDAENACYGWWTEGRSAVSRTLIMDRALFGISGTGVRIWNLDDLNAAPKVLPL